MVRRLVAPLVLTLAVTGCAQLPTSQTYLSEPTYGVYLAFPSDWVVLEATKVEGGNYSQTFGRGLGSAQAALSGPEPSGFVSVSLEDGTLEEVLARAPQFVINNLETAIAEGRAKILQGPISGEDASSVSREWVISVTLDNSSEPLTYRHKVIVGKSPAGASTLGEKQLVKALAIGCTGQCYADNQVSIGTVFSSWKVT